MGATKQRLDGFASDVIVLYETTHGLEYDDQMAFEWSLIYGAFAPAAKGHVVIVNTAGGRPFASLRAKRRDIDALAAGKLDVKGFFDRLEILAIDADD